MHSVNATRGELKCDSNMSSGTKTDFADYIQEFLWATPTWTAQARGIAVYAIAWFILARRAIPYCFMRLVAPRIKNIDQYLELNRATFKKSFFYDTGDDKAFILEQVSLFVGVIAQHGVGGLLGIPSAYNLEPHIQAAIGTKWWPTGIAAALGRHCSLSEVGWEQSDILLRTYQVCFGGPLGRKQNPSKFLILAAMHHCCSPLAIMLNLLYPNHSAGHEGVMAIQISSFVSFSLQQYSYTCDARLRGDRIRMQVASLVVMASVLWARVYVWFKNWRIFSIDYFGDRQELTKTEMAMTIPLALVTVFNLVIVADATKKCIKAFRKIKKC